MPIAKYTSAKGIYQYTDGSSGFFVEDAPVVENQETLAFTHSKTVVKCIADADKDGSSTAAAGGFAATGYLIQQYFFLFDGQGTGYCVWFDDAQNNATDPTPSGYTSVEVALQDDGGDDTAKKVADKLKAVVEALQVSSQNVFFVEQTTDGAADNTLTIISIDPGKTPFSTDVSLSQKAKIESVTPSNDGGTTNFTITHTQSSVLNSAYQPKAYGATSFSATVLAGVATSEGGASLTSQTRVALADGTYVGQWKHLYQNAAGANTSDGTMITGTFIDHAEAARTKMVFNAANEAISLCWNGAAWVAIANPSSVAFS